MTATTLDRPKAPPVLGKTEPRIWTPPLRELIPGTGDPECEHEDCDCWSDRTTDGFAVIAFAEDILGLALFPWQKWLLIHGLELIEDDNGYLVYRFRIVIVCVARQNGKTVIAIVLALWHLFCKHSQTVIGTAQDLSKADDTWKSAVALAENTDELCELFRPEDIFKGHPKTFALLDGCEYRVAAKGSGDSGRGFSGDLILLDELRTHKDWKTWSAVTNTMNARPRAQAWAFSNAGDATSVVLRFQRALAHRELGWPDGEQEFDGVLDDIDAEAAEILEGMDDLHPGWFEYSAPPGAKRGDLEALSQSNPSLNHGEVTFDCPTTRTLLSAVVGSPAYEVETEVMCRWATMGVGGPFPEGSWEETQNPKARPAVASKKVVCVEVSTRRSQTYIARAGLKEDGTAVVGMRYDHPGTDWVAEALIADSKSIEAVVVRTEAGSPSLTLYEELKNKLHGMTVIPWKSTDVDTAHGQMFDRLRDRTVEHLPHTGTDVAATSAVSSVKPGGAFRIDIKRSPTDAAPIYAYIGAVWGLEGITAIEYDVQDSVY